MAFDKPGAVAGTVATIGGYPWIKARNALKIYEMQKRGLPGNFSGRYNSKLTLPRNVLLQSGRVGKEKG